MLRIFTLHPVPEIPDLTGPRWVVLDTGQDGSLTPGGGEYQACPIFTSRAAARLYVRIG